MENHLNEKSEMKGSILAIATYKPKPGKADAFLALVKEHQGVLKKYELITDKPGFVAQSQDGTIIEVFEWVGKSAVDAAHQHPAIQNIWEKMTPIADFTPMKDLPEANRPFPGFSIVTLA
jgi:quinol monooxygenase YgiN